MLKASYIVTAAALATSSLLSVSPKASALAEHPASENAASPRVTLATKPAFGVTFHGIWNYANDTERTQALTQFKDSGGTWIRTDITWSDIEQSPGKYDPTELAAYDDVINIAVKNGLKVLAVIQSTPNWAHVGSTDTSAPPTSPATYAKFAADMSLRYSGKVQAIELWNEPNNSDFFTPSSEPKRASEFFSLEKAAYTSIKKSGAPGIQVMAGGPSYNDDAWWSKLYALGIKNYTDVVAVHPYMSPSNLPPETKEDGGIWTINHLPAVLKVMSAYGDGSKPIWFTEFGWSSHANNSMNTANWLQGVTQAQQAQYLTNTLRLVSGSYPQVKNVFWYNLRNRTNDSIQNNNYGLLNANLTPKPALTALKSAYNVSASTR
ncbi:MAG: glycoside hydrolase family 5 protein [Actinomycetota bacterium]|nr:glycoside hydrolase family 5 protein [Actinomycetota bacterium]